MSSTIEQLAENTECLFYTNCIRLARESSLLFVHST